MNKSNLNTVIVSLPFTVLYIFNIPVLYYSKQENPILVVHQQVRIPSLSSLSDLAVRNTSFTTVNYYVLHACQCYELVLTIPYEVVNIIPDFPQILCIIDKI